MQESARVLLRLPPGFPPHLSDLKSLEPLKQKKIPCSSKCGTCAGGSKGHLCHVSVFDWNLRYLSTKLPKMRREFSKLKFNLESFIFIMYMSMFRIHFGFNRVIPRPKFFTQNPNDVKRFLRANRDSIFQRKTWEYCHPPRDLCELVLKTQPDGKGCCLSKEHWKFLVPELEDTFPILSESLRSKFLPRTIALNFLVGKLIPESCLSLRYSIARRVLNSMQKSAPVPAPKPNLDWRTMFPF